MASRWLLRQDLWLTALIPAKSRHRDGTIWSFRKLLKYCLDNATGKSFLINKYYCKNLDEVQNFATNWMGGYNPERPTMALGGIAPMQRLAMAA